jgi:hypothetical protein
MSDDPPAVLERLARHGGAVGRELQRRRCADAAGGPGDEGDAAFEEPRVGRMEVEGVEVHAG